MAGSLSGAARHRRNEGCAKATGTGLNGETGNPSAAQFSLTEHQIQSVVMKAYRQRANPATVLFAIPNGGARDVVTGKLLKDEGVEAGAPDLFASRKGRCFFIEVKTLNGKVSAAQDEMHRKLSLAGVDVYVCFGHEEVISVLQVNEIIRHPIIKGKQK